MGSTSLNIVDYRGYISGGYTTGENAGAGNGNFAGIGSYYSITQVSWGSVSAASSMGTLTFTTTLRKNSEATVNATAYLSSQGFSGSWDSSKVIAQQTQSVSFSGWNTTSVTFTFNISSRSTSGETLYIWLGGSPLYHHFTSSSGSVSYNLKTYTVSYNANGYGSAPAAQTKTHDSALTLQPFIGNQNITGYTVSYNANGGSSTPSSHNSQITKKQTYWNTNSSGTGTNYSSGGSYTANSSTTLYAIWGSSTNNAVTLASAISRNSSKSTYTISYNANSGSSTPNTQTLTRTTPYSFSKWAAGSTSGSQYSAGGSFTPSANTTMYAIWSTGTTTGSISLAAAISKSNTNATGYTVTFNANGGSCSTSSLTVTDTVKWTFNKWNTKSDGSGTSYNAGAAYSSSANLTLYATWTSSTTKGSITLPTPTRTGYKFLGWATSSTASSGSTGSYTPSSSLTLYAIWKPNGTVRIWHNNGYKMALVYVYSGGKWNLTLPYIYDGSQSKWRMLGG